jgi:SAM-dependent methyltransferase
MKIEQKNPTVGSAKKSPWYTSNQHEAVQGDAKLTIVKLNKFILYNICGYLESYDWRLVRIIDAGCGDKVRLYILRQIPGLEVCGIGYNPLRTGWAQKNFPTAHIVCGDILNLPFSIDSFDIALCCQGIEYIPQDDLLLEKLASVLKPHGLLVIGISNEGCFLARMHNYISQKSILRSTGHIHFYTEQVSVGKLKGLVSLSRIL